MGRDADREAEEIKREIAKEIGFAMKDEEPLLWDPRSRASRAEGKPLIFAFAAIVVLIVFGVVFLSGSMRRSLDSTQTDGSIAGALRTLEADMAKLKEAMIRIKEDTERLRVSVENNRQGADPLADHVAAVERRVMDLEKMLRKGKEQGPPSRPTPKGRVHVVRFGESLSIIAQKYNLSLEDLCRINGVRAGDIIRPGQELKVP